MHEYIQSHGNYCIQQCPASEQTKLKNIIVGQGRSKINASWKVWQHDRFPTFVPFIRRFFFPLALSLLIFSHALRFVQHMLIITYISHSHTIFTIWKWCTYGTIYRQSWVTIAFSHTSQFERLDYNNGYANKIYLWKKTCWGVQALKQLACLYILRILRAQNLDALTLTVCNGSCSSSNCAV